MSDDVTDGAGFFMGVLNTIFLLLAAAAMLFGAVRDAMTLKIPNVASLCLVVLFPFFGLTSAQEPFPWLGHGIVFGLVLGVGYILYARKWAGAGDVKFASAIALWAGPSFWGHFLGVMGLAGGALSVGLGAWAFWKGRVARSREGLGAWMRVPVPYGVAIAVGGLCALLLLSHPELAGSSG